MLKPANLVLESGPGAERLPILAAALVLLDGEMLGMDVQQGLAAALFH